MAGMVRFVKGSALAGAVLGGALALGGCASTGAGSANVASLAAPSPAAAPAPIEAAPIPVPVNYGGFLGGPVGSKLPEADRNAALGAENGAIASGERRTWKGAKGVFGYVVPGPTTDRKSVV